MEWITQNTIFSGWALITLVVAFIGAIAVFALKK